MSIITQALKKAQREQRQHLPTSAASRPPLRPLAVSKRRSWWFLLPVCGVAILAIGLLAQSWRPRLPSTPLAMTAQSTTSLRPDRAPTPDLERSGAQTDPQHVTPLTLEPPPRVPSPLTPAEPEPQPILAALDPSTTIPQAHRSTSTSQARLTVPAAPPRPQAAALQDRSDQQPQAANPSQAETRFNQGLEALQNGNLTEAERRFLQSIALNPSLKKAYNSLGNLYYQRENYTHAETMYQHTLKIDPADVNARNNLGNTYLQLAMYDAAIAELQKAISVNRESSLAYYNLACVYARTGDETLAAQYLDQAIERDPQARSWARTDEDFKPVRSTPEFQKLLGAS